MRRYGTSVLVILCAISCSAPLISVTGSVTTQPAGGELRLHFIDVGQGDCVLVEFPGGSTMLVDCGSSKNGDPLAVRRYLEKALDGRKKIETVVITHPDTDHYNMIPEVLKGLQVGQVYASGSSKEYTEDFRDWLEDQKAGPAGFKVLEEDYNVESPRKLGSFGGVDVRVLASNVGSATNARSIVLMVSFRDFDALLMGDATTETEADMLERFEGQRACLDVEVLKVGHHGSTTSSGKVWMDRAKPEVSVISAADNSQHRHPKDKVLNRLIACAEAEKLHRMQWWYLQEKKNAMKDIPDCPKAVYSTATNGTVMVVTDGGEYWVLYKPDKTRDEEIKPAQAKHRLALTRPNWN